MPPSSDRTYATKEINRFGLRTRLNPDASSLRGLAHPVRMQIMDILRLHGPATATTLARRLGVRTGSTSWHLSKLSQHGFIEEIPERDTGRERWWRSAHEKVLIQYAEAMEAGADLAAATTELMVMGLQRDMAGMIRFLNEDWDFEWRYPAIFDKYDQLVLDPEGLEQLREELWDVTGRYATHPSTSPRARRVIFTMQGYPSREDDVPATAPADEEEMDGD